ncbi:hypothetical protein [Flavobacterium anhuiense]|uniref:hypothetical protein n=1 Tax=Flavobacterium anhuiense TaxID=459526 RepID=UPI0034D95A66
MTKFQKRHRIIATFFLLIFFPTLLPNNLFASNNGPKSPEAASFEPVDATDMVNLITGQYSYVLPLLNVPSPEGGYPLAMAYHAGIALDQEASWTGLGWNVNPGAIDRNINGYPDDYKQDSVTEYFYDDGGVVTTSYLSVGYSNGGASVGVGFSWGSNQAVGGYVSGGIGFDLGGGNSIGINAKVGTSSSSIGVGAQYSGGLSVGVNADTNGEIGVSAGFNNNGEGFSIGYNTNGNYSMSLYGNNATSFSLSTSNQGTYSSISSGGIGASSSKFSYSANAGDFVFNSKNSNHGFFIPTPIGIFSLSFGKQKLTYKLGKVVGNEIIGPLYFVREPSFNEYPSIYYKKYPVLPPMDYYEVNFNNTNLTEESNVENNNAVFPSYDNFNVQAQGLSGNMSAPIFENGALMGVSQRENTNGYNVKYTCDVDNYVNVPYYSKFRSKPVFYLDNEISSYSEANVDAAIFNYNSTNLKIFNHSNGGDGLPKPRRHTSTFVEYYTNKEIATNKVNLAKVGFLETGQFTGYDREDLLPQNGIGAFKITTADGKTYHYSLPVYNYEILTRTFGADGKVESKSYMEKTQFTPFATHWLLTAVTGPDYVDNGDGMAGQGDLGYWTSFEYGNWTEAFMWKAPYKNDYIIDDNNPNIKTWIKGRKQLYYLDKIKTRTHTALFIKSERTDALSDNFSHYAVERIDYLNSFDYPNNPYEFKFSVPSQKQLRLDKIILIKNQDDIVDKKYGADSNLSVEMKYVRKDSYNFRTAKYNMYDNVLDIGDNWQGVIDKAIKIIDLGYDYSLVPGDSRLTLKSVNFKGKGGASILPPYRFEYNSGNGSFDINNRDGWGYLADKPEAFSLNKIITPQGGSIQINYENSRFKSIMPSNLEFYNKNPLKYKCTIPTGSPVGSLSNNKITLTIGSNETYPIQLGQSVNINYSYKLIEPLPLKVYHTKNYNGTGTITNLPANLGTGKYEVTLDGNISEIHRNYQSSDGPYQSGEFCTVKVALNSNSIYSGSSPRVASLKVSDGLNNYITDYKYGLNEDGIGYVSYLPYSQNITKEIPYSNELPAPRVMHEFVTISNHKEGLLPEGKIRYKFNIMKSKDPNKIKFDDFYEIIETKTPNFTNSSNVDVSISNLVVKDNLSSIGQLMEIEVLNGKNHRLSKKTNNFYTVFDNSNNIGVTKESYQNYKTIDYVNTSVRDKWIINSSTRIKYPSILKSSTEQKDGNTYTTEFLDYDLISGISKGTQYSSSNGQSFKTKIVPAYVKYPEMGSKVDNINNKNMLSQVAVNYSYIFDKNDTTKPWKETGVGITTWNNIWSYKDMAGATQSPTLLNEKIWRKHKSYIWNGGKDSNGVFTGYISGNNYDTDDDFKWNPSVGETQSARWKQISEITLYDHFSAPLETKDVNGNYTSTKMGDNNTKITVVGNAGYNEIFYAGGESALMTGFTNFIEPEVIMNNASLNTTYYHTGKRSIAAASNSQFGVAMRSGQHRAGKYKVSVWVEKSNASKARINNNGTIIDFSESYPAGNWVLKVGYVNATSGVYTIYLTSADTSIVYFDDLMIRPISSSITGYVYNEWDELTYIIGNNGLATRFEYDPAGRLIKTYSEVLDDAANQVTGGFKLSKTNTYNNRYLN